MDVDYHVADEDLALAVVPGSNFNPKTRSKIPPAIFFLRENRRNVTSRKTANSFRFCENFREIISSLRNNSQFNQATSRTYTTVLFIIQRKISRQSGNFITTVLLIHMSVTSFTFYVINLRKSQHVVIFAKILAKQRSSTVYFVGNFRENAKMIFAKMLKRCSRK